MQLSKALSYLGGYFNSKEFEIDIPKLADVSESTEEEVIKGLDNLHTSNNIILDGNKVTLLTIKPRKNKHFDEIYAPIETMIWKKGTKLKLDV